MKDLDELKKLIPLADDAQFQEAFANVKRANKKRFAAMLSQELGIEVNPD